jgi:hypothetical protein
MNAAVMEPLLTAAGFEVRGRRYNCTCPGGSKLTGAIIEDRVAHCHRCHTTITARQLANRQGIAIPAAVMTHEQVIRRRFDKWLEEKTWEMSRLEERLSRLAELAKVKLAKSPDDQLAWSALSEWYHARQACEAFWEAATDNLGRDGLYRYWKEYAC